MAEVPARSGVSQDQVRAVADTHAVIWYLFGDRRRSSAARAVFEEAAVDGDVIMVSALTLVEIVYLVERGRIARTALDRLLAELQSDGPCSPCTPSIKRS